MALKPFAAANATTYARGSGMVHEFDAATGCRVTSARYELGWGNYCWACEVWPVYNAADRDDAVRAGRDHLETGELRPTTFQLFNPKGMT